MGRAIRPAPECGGSRARPSIAALLLVLAASGCATFGAKRRSALDTVVESASRLCGCRIAVAARHLESGRIYEYNADAEFESASIIKIAILTEALAQVRQQRIDLAERWTLTSESKADGSGTLLMLDPGLNPTWDDLITLMIGPSDNTAANAWIRRLTIPAINRRMESLGFHHIRLLSQIPPLSAAHDDPSPWRGFRLGLVTARDVAEWMTQVGQGRLLDPESSRRMIEYLDKDPTRLRVARRFSSDFLWAGKSGTMRGVCNDSGILRTKKGRFVITVLTDQAAQRNVAGADQPAALAIADVARAIYDLWAKDLPDIVEKPK